jgi:TIR domain
MKLFISWSGPLSQQVADVLREWIPSVLQSVNPFMSASDVDKGARWTVNISQELAESDYGIICVTPDNIGSPWLNFEAGAISKSIEKGRVSPFLFHVESSSITGPLVQFQHTIYNRPDIFKLVKGINSVCVNPIPESKLPGIFEVWWSRLKEPLDAIKAPLHEGPTRSPEDMLAELIDLVRAQQKAESNLSVPAVNDGIATTNLNKIEIGYLDKVEVSYLLGSLQALTNSFCESPDFNNPKMVRLRALISLLADQMLPLVGREQYNTFLRRAESKSQQNAQVDGAEWQE